MTHDNIIESILKDSDHDLSLFSEAAVRDLENRVFLKTARGKERPHFKCIVRDKDCVLTPEEIVRQLYAEKLMGHYGYPKSQLAFEHPVVMGSTKKRADIVIFDKDRTDREYIIVEVKKPKSKDGKDQLRSYCHATGAQIGVWTNGQQISHCYLEGKNPFEDITDIPKVEQELEDIRSDRFTLKTLFIKDKLANERKSLKEIIKEMEDDVLANAGADVFEEVFKLIFTKLYDEFYNDKDKGRIEDYIDDNLDDEDKSDFEKLKKCLEGLNDDKFEVMRFRNTGQRETKLKKKIQSLFEEAKNKWPGVFSEDAAIALTESHLAICVSKLQNVKLLNSNLMIIDEAFEYLVSKSAKGEKGQYFTPRHVIDMCVNMLNPKRDEYMIDTAAGSCGFPVHTIFKLTGHLFTSTKISDKDKKDALKIFGIDFDPKVVRVARTLNLIAGDGETNVLDLNALDFSRWGDKTEKDPEWINIYGKAFKRLEKLRAEKNENRYFNFDIVMANPPFSGDIKEKHIVRNYSIKDKSDGKKSKENVGRDILFIERNLDFLKPGGRMAIVLPKGRFNNPSDKYIREFIAERCRILAVVGLHDNTFKPHTGTKTSVLFVQKWDDELCPKRDDYPIFFAVSEKSGKNSSGNYVYAKNPQGDYRLDKNRHMIVDHDLHNHGGALEDGIAEAFSKWAKDEKLSFCLKG